MNNKTKTGFTVAAVVTAVLAASSPARAANVITNGGFETGDFTGWTVASSNADSGGCDQGSNVSGSGAATGCYAVASPVFGNYASYSAFDGTGPKTRTLSQSFVVPGVVGSALLNFADTYLISFCCSGGADLARSLDVSIVGTSTTTFYTVTFPYPGTYGAGWTAHPLDITSALSAFAGQTVALEFRTIIPETFSGPAGYGLDAVSLDVTAGATVPEPAMWALTIAGFGLVGSAMRRRRVSFAA